MTGWNKSRNCSSASNSNNEGRSREFDGPASGNTGSDILTQCLTGYKREIVWTDGNGMESEWTDS